LDLSAVTLIGNHVEEDMFDNDEESWHGSAFVYRRQDASVLLYTNAHCLGLDALADNGHNELDGTAEVVAYSLSVTFPSGTKRKALRIAAGAQSEDIACVEVSSEGLKEGRDYVVVPFRETLEALDVRPGDDVVAVGSPIDPSLQQTQTFGKVSALRQNGNVTWIQHDAPISPGNSGGPLFLRRGDDLSWIGVNTLIVVDGNSLGFALSAEDAANCTYKWANADPAGIAALVGSIHGVPTTVKSQ